MSTPFNFLQELSGHGRTLAPSEFYDSTRYIGGAIQNYFFGDEKIGAQTSLSFSEKRIPYDQASNTSKLENITVQPAPFDEAKSKILFSRPELKASPIDDYFNSAKIKGFSLFNPSDEFYSKISPYFNFSSAFSGDSSSFSVAFNSQFSDITHEIQAISIALESSVKYANLLYSNLDLIFDNGEYKGIPVMKSLDTGYLDLEFVNGGYQGAG